MTEIKAFTNDFCKVYSARCFRTISRKLYEERNFNFPSDQLPFSWQQLRLQLLYRVYYKTTGENVQHYSDLIVEYWEKGHVVLPGPTVIVSYALALSLSLDFRRNVIYTLHVNYS